MFLPDKCVDRMHRPVNRIQLRWYYHFQWLKGPPVSTCPTLNRLLKKIQSTLLRIRCTSIDPEQLAEMAAGRRLSLTLSTPMQMIPEIVRSLALNNVAVYQVQLLEA